MNEKKRRRRERGSNSRPLDQKPSMLSITPQARLISIAINSVYIQNIPQ